MPILQLGVYILVPLLSEWICLEELVNFDSALCSNRQELSSLIHLYSHAFQNQLNKRNYLRLVPGLVSWSNSRGLELQNIVLSREIFGIDPSLLDLKLERVKIDYFSTVRAPNIMPWLCSFKSLRCFELVSQSSIWVDELVVGMSFVCSRLTKIDIQQCNLKIESLALLCKANGALRSLITELAVGRPLLFNTLTVHCRQIETVHWRGMVFNWLPLLSIFLLHCRSLTSINVTGTAFPLLIAYHNQRLVNLAIPIWIPCPQMVNVSLQCLCPQLLALHVVSMDRSLAESVPTCLTSLHVDEMCVDDEMLCLIGSRCPGLQKLNIDLFRKLDTSGMYLSRLKELSVGWLNTSFLDLVSRHCHHLQKLLIRNVAEAGWSHSLESVLRACDYLDYLVIESDIEVECLEAIGKYAGGKLTSLSISLETLRYAEFELKEMLQNCTQLTSLTLRHCALSKSVLLCISSSCPKLRTLDIMGTRHAYADVKRCVAKLSRLTSIRSVISEKQETELERIMFAAV